MSTAVSSPEPAAAAVSSAGPVASPVQIDGSCRLPLLVLFVSGAVWLLIGSALGLIASIRFHSPNFLADSAMLTYGRVEPAFSNALLYGFCLPAGLGVALWLLARLGRTALARPWLVAVGALFWNLGVTAGILGILAGNATGFEDLEMPGYAAVLLFLGYLVIGGWGVVTFHRRRERQLFVSQWFLLAALFWFPWIYSTANLLVVLFPLRGVAQAVISWWYSANLRVVWLGLVGLAAVFYLIPRLVSRELHSRYLALAAFWMLILFGGWTGIPISAPVPAWMPALSTVAAVMLVVPMLAVALNTNRTLQDRDRTLPAHPSLGFICFGVTAFALGILMNAAAALPVSGPIVNFTWFTPARLQLNGYGFFAMTMFGAIYYLVPQLTATGLPFPRLMRVHFRLAAAGVLLDVGALAIGGILQGLKLHDASTAFLDVTKGTLHFLRVSTLGDTLLALGHLLFAINLGGLALRFYRARAAAAYGALTTDLKAAEANS